MRCAKNEKTISILTYRFRQSKKADEKTGSDSNKKTKKVEGDLGHTFCKEKHTRARRRGRQESEWGEPNCVVPEFIHDDRKAHSYLPTYLHNFVCVCAPVSLLGLKKRKHNKEKKQTHSDRNSQNSIPVRSRLRRLNGIKFYHCQIQKTQSVGETAWSKCGRVLWYYTGTGWFIEIEKF